MLGLPLAKTMYLKTNNSKNTILALQYRLQPSFLYVYKQALKALYVTGCFIFMLSFYLDMGCNV